MARRTSRALYTANVVCRPGIRGATDLCLAPVGVVNSAV